MVSWQSFYNASQRVQVQMQMSSDKLWKPKCMIGSRCCRGELELNLCPKKDLLTQRIGILTLDAAYVTKLWRRVHLFFSLALWQRLLVLAIVGVSNHAG